MEALGEGSTISHYLLQSKLGQGGMGVVYLATDTRLHRPVALKVLAPGRLNDEDSRRRLIQEARTASGLNHPHIVTIYDIGAAGGRDFVAMEYLSGQTLEAHIDGKPLPPQRAIRYAIQIADALAAAHEAGVVHRDLKPGNVMITRRDHVKLLDFGLAKVPHATPHSEDAMNSETVTAGPMSMAGVLLGTIAYMSPEQVEGRPVGPYTDIFAFGILLYEMLTGARPFGGRSQVATLAAMLHTEPAPIGPLAPGVSPELEQLVAHCLRKKPEERPANMNLVMETLTGIQERSTASSTLTAASISTASLAPPIPPPAVPAPKTGNRAKIAVGAAAVAVAAGLGVWAVGRQKPAEPVAVETVLTRITFDRGFAGFPALSSDGKLIAYVSDRGEAGNLDIWVQQNEPGASPIRITSEESDESEPAFSPDGARIAFRSERENGAVFVAPALGGRPVLIARGGRRPRFSPDGKWIAYWEGGMGVGFVAGSSSVKIVPAGGGTPRPIQPKFDVAAYPVWLPDGSGLVFLGQPGSDRTQRDWWTAPIDGGEARPTGVLAALRARKLTFAPGAYEIYPDTFLGSRLLFTAKVGDGVHVWDIGLGSGVQPPGEPRRLTSGTNYEIQPAVAGDTLAFASTKVTTQIWRLPLRRGEPAGEPAKITDGVTFDAYPSVSDNGKRMAFASDRSGRRSVWIRDLATGRESQLTGLAAVELQPKINAAGDTIVYYEEKGRRMNVVRADPSGRFGTPELLCENCGVPSDVTADGKSVLIEPGGAPHTVQLVDLRTRARRDLIDWGKQSGYAFAPALSHDEKWVAFHANITTRAAARQVFVVPLRGDGAKVEFPDWIPVTDGTAMDREAVWSADDTTLYFLSERDGFRCIWSQRLDPATRKPVGGPVATQHFHRLYRSLGSVPGVVAAIGLTALRDQLVFSLGETSGEVWLQRGSR